MNRYIDILRRCLSHSSTNLKESYSSFFNSTAGSRESNEDNYLVITHDDKNNTAHWLNRGKTVHCIVKSWPSNYVRLAVADGMGGHYGGREIAQAAVEELMKHPPATSPLQMRKLIYALHSVLHKQFYNGNARSPGTTLALIDICLDTKKGIAANLGDSRIYLVGDGQFHNLTYDHTAIEFDFRAGNISENIYNKQYAHQTDKMSQSLGYGSFGIKEEASGRRPFCFDKSVRLDLVEDLPNDLKSHADVFEIQFPPRHSILLATDGLWDGSQQSNWFGPITDTFVSNNELQSQMNSAVKNGSKDNITAVIFGFK